MKIILCFFLFSSCARLSYISEQAFGHLVIEYNGVSNKKVLEDPKVSSEIKRKIRLIMKAKKFFYKYFDLPTTPIYEQTTMLDQDAVTYLVIHSPKNEIKAIKVSLPFIGSFPYLGFYDKEAARDFAKMKETEGFVSYTRPVYAYSTLNHAWIPFYDNILSSFFRYDDEYLVGTIFHELVHTVVFIKNEIPFNENLAQFIADKLLILYYKKDGSYLARKKEGIEAQKNIINRIVELSKELNEKYQTDKTVQDSKQILANFLAKRFRPEMEKVCRANKGNHKCWPLLKEWNNARFAALKTYEAKRDKIAEAFEIQGLDLKSFLLKIIQLEKETSSSKKLMEKLQQGKS